MSHPTIIALDQGTTSSRSVLFDLQGSPLWNAHQEFPQFYPQPGWVEHDPMQILATQVASLDCVVAQAKLLGRPAVAVGITNQRETTILWDRKTGIPCHPAIVWQDRRTTRRCEELKARSLGPMIRERTGLELDPYFSATKLAWILDTDPTLRARAERGELAFGTIDTWLVWNLTGRRRHYTDRSNASRTMLYNLHTGTWDPELLKLFAIPEAVMPEIVRSSGQLGEVSVGAAAGLPICSLIGDQQAALCGQLCTKKGQTKNTYGTGCFALQHIGDKPRSSPNRLLTTVAWQIGDAVEFALEGSVFVGGALVQWLRDGLGIIKSSADIEALARSVTDTGGVIIVPAFTGLGAPYWDARARGTIVGITRGTTKAHIARAAEEAIALQVTELLTAMIHDSGISIPELLVDGGGSRDSLLLQMQADFLGIPVRAAPIAESTARGAALLAALGVGAIKDFDEVARSSQLGRLFEPSMGRPEAATRIGQWQRAVERSRNWIQEDS